MESFSLVTLPFGGEAMVSVVPVSNMDSRRDCSPSKLSASRLPLAAQEVEAPIAWSVPMVEARAESAPYVF
jgi:hypothetical protein